LKFHWGMKAVIELHFQHEVRYWGMKALTEVHFQ
jgi:hypothetical protein